MPLIRNRTVALTAACVTLLASLGVAMAGCAQSDNRGGNPAIAPPPPPAGGGGGRTAGSDAALVAAGKAVFNANGCARCHAVGGQSGRGGPDLSRVGAEAQHTPEWLVAHIKNPKAHNPSSRMPAFAGKISDKDMLALGAYLASLK